MKGHRCVSHGFIRVSSSHSTDAGFVFDFIEEVLLSSLHYGMMDLLKTYFI